MGSGRGLALLACWILAGLPLPRAADAVSLPFTGTLSLQFGGLAPVAVNGSGTAVLNGTGAVGAAITQLSVPAGAFSMSALVAPLSAASPIVQFQVLGSNGAIALSAGQAPCSVPQSQVACAGSGVLHGRAGLQGLLAIGVLGSFGAPLATLPVPLSPLGGGGAVTVTNTSLAASARIVGAGWTTAKVSAFRSVLGEIVSTLTAVGGVSQTVGGAWSVQMVTPIAIQSSLAPGVTLPAFARIQLLVVPEPSTGLLLGIGCLGSAAIGRRRMRRERRRRLDRALAAFLVFAAASPARVADAEVSTQTRGLDGGFAQVAFTPFDPALGTLDRVVVHIEGNLEQGFLPTQIQPPTLFAIQLFQRFSSPFGRGFEFESDASAAVAGVTTLAGPLFQFISYDFAFTQQSDMVGFTVPQTTNVVPPTSVNGTRAEFERLPIPGDPGIHIDMLLPPPIVVQGPVTALPTLFHGLMVLQYVYTPPASPAPPPGPDRVLVPVFDATDTLRIDSIDPQTQDVVVAFDPGALRLPVLVGGLWPEPDGSVLVTHENDKLFPDVLVVKRLRADGSIEVVTTLGGLSDRPGVERARDTALVDGMALIIADAGPGDGGALDGRIVRVDPATGDARVLVDAGVLANPNRLATDRDGRLYVAESQDAGSALPPTLYELDPDTGTLTQIASGGLLGPAADLIVAPDGRLLWLVDAPPGVETQLVRIDPVTRAQVVAADRIVDARGVFVTESLGIIDFPSVGIIALSVEGLNANSDGVARMHIALYADDMIFAVGGDVDDASGAPSSVPKTACNDGMDDDGDGDVDLADPGCVGPLDLSEEPDCADGLDNDRDGSIDAADDSCDSVLDPSEHPECSNGMDDDGDGARDFPLDPGCLDALSPSESPACSNGIDDDGDGAIDTADWGCLGPADDDEQLPRCANGIDDDGDGHVDYPDDPGCRNAFSEIEDPRCNNGVDDDLDGDVDLADEVCTAAYVAYEDATCHDGLDNDSDGQIDFGIPGVPMSCNSQFDCFDGYTYCIDFLCAGGPRFDLACATEADCGIECVDGLCEEAAIPRACNSSDDCDGAACNSAGSCVATGGGAPEDEDCVRLLSEDPSAANRGVEKYCGLGGELLLAYALVRLAVRRLRASA